MMSIFIAIFETFFWRYRNVLALRDLHIASSLKKKFCFPKSFFSSCLDSYKCTKNTSKEILFFLME
jgi:hypothetical protein